MDGHSDPNSYSGNGPWFPMYPGPTRQLSASFSTSSYAQPIPNSFQETSLEPNDVVDAMEFEQPPVLSSQDDSGLQSSETEEIEDGNSSEQTNNRSFRMVNMFAHNSEDPASESTFDEASESPKGHSFDLAGRPSQLGWQGSEEPYVPGIPNWQGPRDATGEFPGFMDEFQTANGYATAGQDTQPSYDWHLKGAEGDPRIHADSAPMPRIRHASRRHSAMGEQHSPMTAELQEMIGQPSDCASQPYERANAPLTDPPFHHSFHSSRDDYWSPYNTRGYQAMNFGGDDEIPTINVITGQASSWDRSNGSSALTESATSSSANSTSMLDSTATLRQPAMNGYSASAPSGPEPSNREQYERTIRTRPMLNIFVNNCAPLAIAENNLQSHANGDVQHLPVPPNPYQECGPSSPGGSTVSAASSSTPQTLVLVKAVAGKGSTARMHG